MQNIPFITILTKGYKELKLFVCPKCTGLHIDQFQDGLCPGCKAWEDILYDPEYE